ncbi:AraC family transcriptional regulator [Sulfurimonas sp.]
MKKATLQKRIKIANDIMYYIYTNIDTDINIDELSLDMNVSKFHMQRIFKEVFQKNIYASIKSIRLQKASSLLLTNKHSTISNIASMCGYSSHSSFINAFKNRFLMTPKEWREGGYKSYAKKILKDANKPNSLDTNFSKIIPTIVKEPKIQAYYIRNNGYAQEVKRSWQKLYTWVLSNNLQEYKQIALFHDNLAITPLDECQYVACIATKQSVKSDRLPQFYIAGGVYARFDFFGTKGDILRFIDWAYHDWLIENEYETSTKPAYAIYHTNAYLDGSDVFDVSFYLPIAY